MVEDGRLKVHTEPHELALAVINDVGHSLAASRAQRIRDPEFQAERYVQIVAETYREQRKKHGSYFTLKDVLDAVMELHEFYTAEAAAKESGDG